MTCMCLDPLALAQQFPRAGRRAVAVRIVAQVVAHRPGVLTVCRAPLDHRGGGEPVALDVSMAAPAAAAAGELVDVEGVYDGATVAVVAWRPLDGGDVLAHAATLAEMSALERIR